MIFWGILYKPIDIDISLSKLHVIPSPKSKYLKPFQTGSGKWLVNIILSLYSGSNYYL